MTEKEKELKEKLEQIGCKLVHHGCEHYYIYSPENKPLNISIWRNRLEVEDESMKKRKASYVHWFVVSFDLEKCDIDILDTDTVAIGLSHKNFKKQYPFILIFGKGHLSYTKSKRRKK